jgi:hypothetical protein
MRSSFGEANWNILYKLAVTVRDTPRVSLSRFPRASASQPINQSINPLGIRVFHQKYLKTLRKSAVVIMSAKEAMTKEDARIQAALVRLFSRDIIRPVPPPSFGAMLTELLTRVCAGYTKTVHLPCPPHSSRPDRQRRQHQ